MQPIITVRNIGKKYILGHGKQKEDCSRFSELMMMAARSAVQRIAHPFSPNRATTDIEEFWALQNINFEVEQGDRVGIIGRNGSGKSTMLKILSRIVNPTTGNVRIRGRIASLLEVGTGFHPELTGRENIFLNGTILGMTRAEIRKKFDEIVDFAGVEKFLDTPVKRYSSGMYVRLAFAVAANLEPEILLVDEVLAVGDMEFQKKCLGKMDDISKNQGRTILFVSHNMGAVRRLCNKGLLLAHGRIAASGTASDAIAGYQIDLTELKKESMEWEPDNRKPVSILKIRLLQHSDDLQGDFDISDRVRLAVTYQVNEEVHGCFLGISLAKDGMTIFNSWDIDQIRDKVMRRSPGIFTEEITIDPVLSAGDFSVSVFAGRPNFGYFEEKRDCLLFTKRYIASDPTNLGAARSYFVLPPVHWKKED